MGVTADVLVAGLPRSGTTLVSNLLTDIDRRRWCVVEPGSLGCQTQPRIFNRARRMGWAIPSNDIGDVLAFLGTLDRWGVKEIRHWLIESAYKVMNPRHVLVCARDMRDVAVSLREFRYQREKRPHPIVSWLNEHAEHLVQNVVEQWADKVTIVRYERFVVDPGYRNTIAQAIDWEFTGDPNQGLHLFRRSDEIRDGIFSRRTERDRERHGDLVAEVERAAGDYQCFFGYGE